MHQSADGVLGLKPDAGGTRECIGYERWVSDLDELDHDLAIGEPMALHPSKLGGQARLSGASRPQDGQKTGVSQKAAQLAHFLLPSDEVGEPPGDTSGSAHHVPILVRGYVPAGTTVIRTPWETRAGHVRRKSETIEGLQRLGRRRKPIDDRLRDSSAATALRGQPTQSVLSCGACAQVAPLPPIGLFDVSRHSQP